MVESIMFILSSVLTARFLDKRKMRIASVGYSVMFISVFGLLIFSLDIPLFRTALINVFGKIAYNEFHILALRIVSKSFYGISVITLIALSISVQLAIAIYGATKTAVQRFCAGVNAERKFKKVYYKYARSVRNLYLPKRINLLYCRMLN